MPYHSPSPTQPIIKINPVLDFTEDTAFVAVKMPGSAGPTACEHLAVITSNRELYFWNEESQFGACVFADGGRPRLLESRWSSQSIREFQNGAEPPTSTAIHQSIRAYLQKYLGLRHPVEYDLVALWIMGTYLKPLFKCYPILFFNAPYESGKSRCLEAVSQLSFNGKWFGEISPAAFRRYSAEIKPTFCLDEMQEVGIKNNSTMIAILLNAYNSSEVMLTGFNRHSGWLPEVYKVTSPVALGNIQEIKNKALQSRTIQIRTEYDPRYKNINLPGVGQLEPSRIRDGLYGWFLGNWRSVRERYQSYPVVPALSAREIDSYKPLLAIAALAGPEVAEAVTGYAGAVRDRNLMVKNATDDRYELLAFLRQELDARSPREAFPVIANKTLTDAYNSQNRLRLNYRRFLEMVNAIQVVMAIKNYSGSRYLVLNRAEIERQLQVCAAKA